MFLQKTIKSLKRKQKDNLCAWLDLDTASTTPTASQVLATMKPYFSEVYFNPSAIHAGGQFASRALTHSRQEVADYFSVSPNDILFTASATEANNWVVESSAQISLPNKEKPHIIYSAIEHDSVIAPIVRLEQRGLITASVLPVDNNGLVDISELEKTINPRTVLVSIIAVNNEVGTLEPLSLIGQCLENFRKQNQKSYPYFHSDAAQALNYFSWSDLKFLDFITFSGHKIYGPKGIGGLTFFNHRALQDMVPLIVGGHQEFNLKAGTENLPAIVGLAQTLALLKQNSVEEKTHLLNLRSIFWTTLLKENKSIRLNGDLNCSVPSIINCYFPGVLASDMVIGLSEKGVLASQGAACSASLGVPSHVVNAMYHDKTRAQESVRFSFSRHLRTTDVKHAAHLVTDLYNQLASL